MSAYYYLKHDVSRDDILVNLLLACTACSTNIAQRSVSETADAHIR